jgi:hypothetical protein
VPKPAPVSAQPFEQRRAQHHVPVLASLAAANVNHHPLAVDVGHLQASYFCPACTRSVQSHDQNALKRCLGRIDQLRHFLLAEDLRKPEHLLRVGRLGGGPASLQNLDVKETQCGEPLRDRVRSQLPGPEHRRLVLPDVLQTKLVRRTTKVLSKVLDGADVSANRPRSVVAPLQLFQHDLT